jgi:transposase-like protein
MNTRWTDEEKAQMTKLWGERKTVSEIAQDLGKSESAVKNQRRALKLEPRRTGSLKVKVRVGIHEDEYALLRKKALRVGQTIPGRIRTLIQQDLRNP